VLGGAAALGLGAALGACGAAGEPDGSADGPTSATDRSRSDKVVNWANWRQYLDFEAKTKTYPTLEDFQRADGIRVTYDEAIDDNDTYYAKIQAELKNGEDIGKDIVTFTDWMAGRLIRQGYVQKLDRSVIPNAKNLRADLRNPVFDPGRAYSLTWQSGYAGLAYDVEQVPKGLKSVADLWDPALKGRVELLSEFRDTLGLIMLSQGADITTCTKADFDTSLQTVEKYLTDGQVRQIKGNSYLDDLVSGDAVAVMAWSGDIIQLDAQSGGRWKFVLPESGGTLWSDDLLIPLGSPHKENAEILINYYYDPRIAAEVAAYVRYICPVQGAQEAMHEVAPQLADDEFIFPTADDRKQAHVFRSLTPAEETTFAKEFQRVLGI
jgi:spermidine/putrescine transport system substrate-binding protein